MDERARQPVLVDLALQGGGRAVRAPVLCSAEVKYKTEIFGGEQPAILDRKLFEAVQVKLDQQRSNHTTTRYASDSLLMGLIFDDRGNRMTPTHATKVGVRYRYYISAVLNQGQAPRPPKSIASRQSRLSN
jgi:hypothetical protein